MKTIISILILNLSVAYISAQEVISNGGDSFSNGTVQMDFTLGELAIETISSNVQLTQGFHQGVSSITSINENNLISYEVYPNPTSDWIGFNIADNGNKSAWINIFNIEGRLVKNVRVVDVSNAKFSIEDLAAGTFVMHVEMDESEQNFKPILIQKQ